MMLARSSAIYTLPRMLLLVLLVGTFGCGGGTATYIQAKVTDNPLDRVAQQAQEDWSLDRVDANTLHLSQVEPLESVIAIGYCAFHAKLFYAESDSVLHIQYYLQKNTFYHNLFLSILDTTHSDFEQHQPLSIANRKIYDILRWSKASVITRYGGPWYEPFPWPLQRLPGPQ